MNQSLAASGGDPSAEWPPAATTSEPGLRRRPVSASTLRSPPFEGADRVSVVLWIMQALRMSGLDFQSDGRVARIRFARPTALNSLTPALLESLVDRCHQLTSDKTTRVVVLEGEGPCFSAGADVPAFATKLGVGGTQARTMADIGRRVAQALFEVPQITMASIHSHCLGGGMVLAGACDLRMASEDARFQVPELRAGVPLAWGGLARLIALMGETAATEVLLTGRAFGALEAKKLGFISTIIEDPQREAVVGSLAAEIAELPSLVLRTTKKQLRAMREGRYDAATDADALLASASDEECRNQGSKYWFSQVLKTKSPAPEGD